ncbi:NeuD/PglB/VioB family sugar acetyltransferase [Microbacterium esteraromaticum]|uniref:NeuD/PglB/VioB family sugar acetyltransferase n=1 Tax=Microbacterium esteraromaticum TaxID=57043 RepID=A0A939DW48_9MICO|nr:NeuD/PglB/VioB family sugar acetyltransferase [Microbacterium esteraromaticum]MBN8205352.1 NeuD/PglB/VioB family sugar acetyltransferase [Microbacterium esteraromaticum]MBN8415506.1 NeuD/PglB/VioB family sugar acetyltransferase [Microbacterium esteraromaticum]
MTEQVVVVGAGGFGRETVDVVEAVISGGGGIALLGIVDANPREADLQQLSARGIAYLGTEEQWLPYAPTGSRFIVAIGNPRVRGAVADRLLEAGLHPITVIHPQAVIGSQATIGAGVVICAGVQVSTNVTLGDHVHLNPACIIGHDAELENCVSVNPGAIVSGNVRVRENTLLGAGSMVLQGLTIAAGTTVGAGACVTKDTRFGWTVAGVPARPMRGRDV